MQPASAGAGSSGGRERPRFRQDLIAEPVEDQGGRFIDVMAPDSGNVFRLYEVEYSLACGMDGERDIAGIVKWAQDELGLTPSPHEVRTVIATLGDLGFIDGAAVGAVAAPAVGAVAAPAVGAVAAPAVGAVAAPPVKPPAAPGVELGVSGAGPRSGSLPAAPDLALGAAGAAVQRTTRPTPAPAVDVPVAGPSRPMPVPEAVPPDVSDVSIDLADHMAVRPDDVQEAVRASRVMSAVDAPPEPLPPVDDEAAAAAEAEAVAAAEEAAAVDAVFGGPTEVARPADMAVRAAFDGPTEVAVRPEVPRPSAPEVRVGKTPPTRQPAGKPPVELSRPPPPAASRPSAQTATIASPAPRRAGVSPVLIIVLVLVVLGGGGFLVWKYLLQKPGIDGDTTAAPVPPPVKPAPPPAPPPPPPAAKIALETPAPDDVKVARAGMIENILADKTEVKEHDVVVRLVGDKPLEAEITALTRDTKRLQDLIDAATRRREAAHTTGNKAVEAAAQTEINERSKTLTIKQGQLNTKTTDLDSFVIHAASSGVVSPIVKQNQKVAAGVVVARIQRDPIPVATFKVSNTRPFAANASVEVAIGKGEQRATCTIADIQPDSVKVTCPADPALTDGVDVTLQAPSATAPEAPPEPPPPPPLPSSEPGQPPPGAPPEGSAAAPSGAPPPEGSAGAPSGGPAAGSAGSAATGSAAP